jgi:hypothetical protein
MWSLSNAFTSACKKLDPLPQFKATAISCVDTRSARNEIIRSPLFKKCAYWLDIGNTADGGQFVLGQPRNNRNRRTPSGCKLSQSCFRRSSNQASTKTTISRRAMLLRLFGGRSPSSTRLLRIRLWLCLHGFSGMARLLIMAASSVS